MYEYAYSGTWYVYDEPAHWLYYMLIGVKDEYVLVYIDNVWVYVLLNVMSCEVGALSWFLLSYLSELGFWALVGHCTSLLDRGCGG